MGHRRLLIDRLPRRCRTLTTLMLHDHTGAGSTSLAQLARDGLPDLLPPSVKTISRLPVTVFR